MSRIKASITLTIVVRGGVGKTGADKPVAEEADTVCLPVGVSPFGIVEEKVEEHTGDSSSHHSFSHHSSTSAQLKVISLSVAQS